MLAREYTGQKTGYWHNDAFVKSEAQWSRIISRDRQYIRRFQSDYGYKSFSILINFEKFPTHPMRFHLTEVDLKISWLGES